MSSTSQSDNEEISQHDEHDVMQSHEDDGETCFVESIATEVQKRIYRESKEAEDSDDEWNIVVLRYFDDVFESVPMAKVWRRFLLTLYLRRPPIDESMINDIMGHHEGYRSAVLDAVLKLGEPAKWVRESGEADETDASEEEHDTDDSDTKQTDDEHGDDTDEDDETGDEKMENTDDSEDDNSDQEY